MKKLNLISSAKSFGLNKIFPAFLMCLLLLIGAGTIKAQTAQNFTLTDQFGNQTSVVFPSSKPVVLVFGDREGSEQVEGWVRPLYGKFTDRIYIFGIAELSAVPSLARGVVRRIIKSKSKTSVMLDWSGSISKAYGYKKGKANIFVMDTNGKIVAKAAGAATETELQNIYRKINQIF